MHPSPPTKKKKKWDGFLLSLLLLIFFFALLTSEGVLFRSSKWILFFMSMSVAGGSRSLSPAPLVQ